MYLKTLGIKKLSNVFLVVEKKLQNLINFQKISFLLKIFVL